jgi:SAM-dependent methyltransferase
MKIFKSRMEWAFENYLELKNSSVLDVGCGTGVHLKKFGYGSLGIDGKEHIPLSEKYKFVLWNFNDDILDLITEYGYGKFKYIWCNNVLEQVMSPHLFLNMLFRSLCDEGLLFLGVPIINVINSIPFLKERTKLFNGFLSQDHVNFFTYKSLVLTIQYSGFEVVGRYSPFLSFCRKGFIFKVEPFVMLVLRRVKNFQYGPKAFKELDCDNRLKWRFIDKR